MAANLLANAVRAADSSGTVTVETSKVAALMREQDRYPETCGCSPRWTVLACLADDAAHRDVAEQLNLSVNTVRTRLKNLATKLGVHSVLKAVALTRDYTGWLPGGGSS